jgi:hypothetical protein
MGLLEDALRETLAAKVASPPAVDAPADRAIRAAALARRRRAVGLSATAVVGALALTLSIGLVATGSRIGAGFGLAGPKADRVLSVPFATAVEAPAYVLSGGEIVGPSGSQVSVRGQMATRAWRLPGAYLVESRTPVSSGVILWRVPVDGGARRVLLEADQIAVAPAGQAGLPVEQGPAIAWSDGRTVSWGILKGADLVALDSTTVSTGLRVAGMVNRGVLLTTGDTFDLWFPDKGAFVPGPTVASRSLVAAADGTTLYGVVNGNGCLSRLDPHGFEVLDRTCAVAVGSHDALAPSPDGRWLVDASIATVRLFKLPTVFDKPVSVASWSLHATDVGWLGDGAFAVLTPDGLVRLTTDQAVSKTPVPVPVEPDGPDSAQTLVADLTTVAR